MATKARLDQCKAIRHMCMEKQHMAAQVQAEHSYQTHG